MRGNTFEWLAGLHSVPDGWSKSFDISWFPWYPKDFLDFLKDSLDIERCCRFPGFDRLGADIIFGSVLQTTKMCKKNIVFAFLVQGNLIACVTSARVFQNGPTGVRRCDPQKMYVLDRENNDLEGSLGSSSGSQSCTHKICFSKSCGQNSFKIKTVCVIYDWVRENPQCSQCFSQFIWKKIIIECIFLSQ